ncbi:hypothetical protein [Halobaculum rubrum]|uniref:hypothetical protein n=1 Tax=Halobaculum rubrum TaxID=2872158 RepID=UPI001CA38D11|nr:hypothetical protein [Halobaculum rubrum]QZY00304.1 hypothetical protein K6T25_04185 [Halobaculum rubrum]
MVGDGGSYFASDREGSAMGSDPSTESTGADRPDGDTVAPSPPVTDGGGTTRPPYAPVTLLRDWVAAAVVVVGLYALLYAVPLPPFGVPGYLLVVAFDWLEPVLPTFPTSGAYDAAFAGFLAALATVAAIGGSAARSRGARDGWHVGAGSGLATVGVVGAVLAVGVFAANARGDYVPFLLVTGTSLALLAGGRVLAFGRLGRRSA